MARLLLVRHGESKWNLENRFTGWYDVGLSEKGEQQARLAGATLAKASIFPDYVFTSLLSRAIKTAFLLLDAMDRLWLPFEKDWRLNERHYGALQGLNKKEAEAYYTQEQIYAFRRKYDEALPQWEKNDDSNIDKRYHLIKGAQDIKGETLKAVCKRVDAFYQERIYPLLIENKTILIVCHGNTIRAFLKNLQNLDENTLSKLEIPNALPYQMEFDQNKQLIKADYILDESVFYTNIEA